MHPLLTLPTSLSIKRSESSTGGEYTICSLEDFPILTTFGPHRGAFISRSEQKRGDCLSQVESEPESIHLDGLDGMESNWLRYVKNASKIEEANLVAVETKSGFYYVTSKVIPANRELLVWYPVIVPQQKEGYAETVLETFQENDFEDALATVDIAKSQNDECRAQSESTMWSNTNNAKEKRMKKTHQEHSSTRKEIIHNSSLSEGNLYNNSIIKMELATKSRMYGNTKILWSTKEAQANSTSRKKLVGSNDGKLRDKRISQNHTRENQNKFSTLGDTKTVQKYQSIRYGDIAESGNEIFKRFNSNHNRKERIGRGGKHRKCKECGKKHIFISTLKKQKVMHLEEGDYKSSMPTERNDLKIHKCVPIEKKCQTCGEVPTAWPFECKESTEDITQMENLQVLNRRYFAQKYYKSNIHKNTFIQKRKQTLHKTVDTGETANKLKICSRKFSQMRNIKTQNMTHMGDRPYKCKVCQKAFINKSALMLHERVHTEEKPYECKTCSRKFSMLHSLKTHSMVHIDERPYKCTVCQRVFIRKNRLKLHQRIHTGERPYECTTCSRGFTDMYTLKMHNMIHTGERPHKCNICQKGFIRKRQLKLHQRIHTGEKPYECKTCSRKFSYLLTFQRHNMIHTGERPHKCNVCQKAFIRNHDLKLHQRVHTGEKPYECKTCSRRFSQLGNLQRHNIIHTGERYCEGIA